MQKGVKDFIFFPQCMYIQRFDRVWFCFIFTVLAPKYSLKPPRFYGNKGIILNQWTAKYGACPINPEERVLFIPIVPVNTEITPIDKSFAERPRREGVTLRLRLAESWRCGRARAQEGGDAGGDGGTPADEGVGGCRYPGRAARPHPCPAAPPGRAPASCCALLGCAASQGGLRHGCTPTGVLPVPSLIPGLSPGLGRASAVGGQGVTAQRGGTLRASPRAIAAKAEWFFPGW